MATITFDARNQIWETAAKDEKRPVLTGVYVDNNGWATATDSFVMASVKVEITGGLPSSGVIIPAQLLKDIFKREPKAKAINVMIEGDRVISPITGQLIEGQYPNFKSLYRTHSDSRPIDTVRIDPELLVRLSKALGDYRQFIDKQTSVTLYSAGEGFYAAVSRWTQAVGLVAGLHDNTNLESRQKLTDLINEVTRGA